jgi:hypothetical protein
MHEEFSFSSADIALRPSKLILKYGFRFQIRQKTCKQVFGGFIWS